MVGCPSVFAALADQKQVGDTRLPGTEAVLFGIQQLITKQMIFQGRIYHPPHRFKSDAGKAGRVVIAEAFEQGILQLTSAQLTTSLSPEKAKTIRRVSE